MQPHGSVGQTRFLTMGKKTALSQIPGLKYPNMSLANLPKPVQWEDQALTPAALQAIDLTVLGQDIYDPKEN